MNKQKNKIDELTLTNYTPNIVEGEKLEVFIEIIFF